MDSKYSTIENDLQIRWFDLLTAYTIPENIIETYWKEIVQYYTQKHRAYHNLNHLSDLFDKLDKLAPTTIHDLPALQFSIWYHDIIYQPLSKKNEEKSAILCSKRLQKLGFEANFKEKVFKLICSTKTHILETWEHQSEQSDNAYLLDLDLSILGSPEQNYRQYISQIRAEYKIVPAFLYKKGRKKVLQHFLEMDRIFKTDLFFDQYEEQARKNIRNEVV